MIRRAAPGLTLVETLVGLVLLGLVMSLALSALGLVGRAGRVAAADRTELGLVQDLLRLRLLAALPIPEEGRNGGAAALIFEGRPEALAFVAELPPRFGLGGPALLGLRHEQGALLLSWRALPGGEAGEGGPEGRSGRRLLEGVEALRLRYFGAPRPGEAALWRDTWSEAAVLPMAIELNLDFAAEDARRWTPLVVAPRLAHRREAGG